MSILSLLLVLLPVLASTVEPPPLLVADIHGQRLFRLDAGGTVVWEHRQRNIHDCWQLHDGRVLYAFPSEIRIVDDEQSVERRYRAPEGYRLYSCQPLAEGRVLTAITGPETRILEIDSAGTVVVDIQTERARQIRLVRKTPTGSYLLAARSEEEIWEYTADGRLLRRIPAPGNVYLAVRLPNGNTMIACGDGHSLVEVDIEDRVVWHLAENDLPGIPLRFVAGFQALDDNTLVLCNWGGHGHLNGQAQILAVDRAKNVLWRIEDWQRFQTPCHVQVLLPDAQPLMR